MNKKATWIAATSVLLVGLITASVFGWRKYKATQVVAEAKAMQAKMFDENTSSEERSKMWEQMRSQRENMSEAERQAFGRQMRDGMKQRMMQRIDDYFAMPEEDRVAFLDEEIRRGEERRQEWEKRRQEREQNGETEERGGRGDRGDRGGRAGRGGPGGGGGDPAERSQRRDEFRRRISDNTTAEERAKFQAYREAIQERREELGLPPGGGWHGGGRGGRR